MEGLKGLLLIILILSIFLLPSYIANKKKHPAKIAIIITNLLGGLFYGIGWIIALIWVFNGAEKRDLKIINKQNISISEEISRLHKLKEENIISEEDFLNKKNELLNS